MAQKSTFLLSKWYMDCVSDDGDIFIGYAATVRWKALSINYSSSLELRNDEEPRTRTSLLRFSSPATVDGSIEWSSEALGIEAAWHRIASPLEHSIFKSEIGDIQWRCLAPIAQADVRIQDRPRIKGIGYVEYLAMSIPPWLLPMDELRWGRFLSESDHLVWIEWRGPLPFTLVFHNGVAIDGARVTDDEIVFADRRLTISKIDRRILREGTLISTALGMVPGLRQLVSRRILDAHESKWCSKGVMKKSESSDATGWVIHEVVRWGK